MNDDRRRARGHIVRREVREQGGKRKKREKKKPRKEQKEICEA